MFELTGNTQLLYCIGCGRDAFVHVSKQGEQFHVHFAVSNVRVISKNSALMYDAVPVTCRGPFAHSEAPAINHDYIEQLSSLTADDRYFPSVAEVLIDNIRSYGYGNE